MVSVPLSTANVPGVNLNLSTSSSNNGNGGGGVSNSSAASLIPPPPGGGHGGVYSLRNEAMTVSLYCQSDPKLDLLSYYSNMDTILDRCISLSKRSWIVREIATKNLKK